jgi:transposase
MATKHKYASDGVKESVVALVKHGNSFQKVADMLKMSKTSVHRIYRNFCERGTVKTAPKTGRKKSIGERDGRKILRQVKSNRKTPLADITDDK